MVSGPNLKTTSRSSQKFLKILNQQKALQSNLLCVVIALRLWFFWSIDIFSEYLKRQLFTALVLHKRFKNFI